MPGKNSVVQVRPNTPTPEKGILDNNGHFNKTDTTSLGVNTSPGRPDTPALDEGVLYNDGSFSPSTRLFSGLQYKPHLNLEQKKKFIINQ